MINPLTVQVGGKLFDIIIHFNNCIAALVALSAV